MSAPSPSNASNPYASLRVAPVINAAGKMTALGGTAQSDAVALASRSAAGVHVDLDILRAAAGRRIAALTGADAASITTGAASGIAIGVAAILTGTDLDAIRRLPDYDGPNTFLIQSGHDINFGADVVQMIRLGGGRAQVVGTPGRVRLEDFMDAMSADVAGCVYIKSHHCVQDNRVSLEDVVALTNEAGLETLVDAAAEHDLRCYIAAGADLVTYSGGKAIGGPTVGFITGRSDLIEACELQHRGIARSMKVGKEQIMGLMAALDVYSYGEKEAAGASEAAGAADAVLNALVDALSPLPKIDVSIVPDRAGRPIRRVGITSSEFELAALVGYLRDGSPSIRTRNHQLDEGYILLDTRELRLEHVPVIADRIQAFVRG